MIGPFPTVSDIAASFFVNWLGKKYKLKDSFVKAFVDTRFLGFVKTDVKLMDVLFTVLEKFADYVDKIITDYEHRKITASEAKRKVKEMIKGEFVKEAMGEVKKKSKEAPSAFGGLLLSFGLGSVFGDVISPFLYGAFGQRLGQFGHSIGKDTLLTADQYINLIYRNPALETKITPYLYRLGYADEQIGYMKELFKYIPSPTDLIRLAVREAFRDELVAAAEAKYPTPRPFIEWAKKVGMTEDWCKRFWYAHWVLPSPTAIYEMWRRGVLPSTKGETLPKPKTSEDVIRNRKRSYEWLKQWLALNDYHPTSMEGMIEIAKLVPTRVDIRRMYRLGIYTRDDVKKQYLRLGYDEEDAEALTEFTVRSTIEEEKDITKSEILKAVKIGQISKDEAIEMLVDLGYEEDDAEFLVTLHLAKKKSEERELSQSWIIKQYKLGLASRDAAKAALMGLGYSSDAAENILKIVDYEKAQDFRPLDFGYLRTLYREGFIDESYFRQYLRFLGFLEQDIEIIVARETSRRKKK